jgi:bifunctional enzyme Fae/Hps
MRAIPISRLSKKLRYLQVAFNGSREDMHHVLAQLPPSSRMIYEAGTPLIKHYGTEIIRELRGLVGADAYIVADMKTIDRGATEVELCKDAGADAVIAMGTAPIETLDAFVASCHEYQMDAMIDMMNVEFPLSILRALKHQPKVVILHRGVDEEVLNRSKMLPLHEIRRIKGAGDTMIAVAGGDTPREIQSAAFNDADIVVVWKSVLSLQHNTLELVEGFLKTIK